MEDDSKMLLNFVQYRYIIFWLELEKLSLNLDGFKLRRITATGINNKKGMKMYFQFKNVWFKSRIPD